MLRERLGSAADAGVVHVLRGGAGGLTARRARYLVEGTAGVPGAAERWDQFGAALAAGDVDGDGRDELAIGARTESVGSANAAGAVVLLRGGGGLFTRGGREWSQNSPGVVGVAQTRDYFGACVLLADFDGDGYDDLAVGLPGQAYRGRSSAGSAQILFGGRRGLGAAGDFVLDQASPGIADRPEAYDTLGGFPYGLGG